MHLLHQISDRYRSRYGPKSSRHVRDRSVSGFFKIASIGKHQAFFDGFFRTEHHLQPIPAAHRFQSLPDLLGKRTIIRFRDIHHL